MCGSSLCNLLISFCITCVCCDRLGTHEHSISTQRLHLGLVLLAWQQAPYREVGEECCALQLLLVVDSEHGDG